MKNRIHRLLRATAIATLVAYLPTSIDFSYAASGSIPLEMAVPSSFKLEQNLALGLPSELGRMDSFHPGSKGTLLHIQTAHGHYEAQEKIEKLLGWLSEKFGDFPILLEGAADQLDPSRLEFFPGQPEANLQNARWLAKKSLVTGSELFLLRNKKATGIGVESEEAYRKNHGQFARVLKAKKEAEHFSEAFKLQMEKKAAVFAPELRAFLKRLEQGALGIVPLDVWLPELRRTALKYLNLDLNDAAWQVRWPMMVRFFKIQSISQEFNSEKFESEKTAFLIQIQKHLPASGSAAQGIGLYERVELLLNSMGKSAQLPEPETENAFTEMLRFLPADFDFEPYREVVKWIALLVLQSQLDFSVLAEEISRLESLIAEKLTRSEDEKNLLKIFTDYRLLEKLLALQLTPSDFDKVTAESAARIKPSMLAKQLFFSVPHLAELDVVFDEAVSFYRGVKLRDDAMIQRAQGYFKKHHPKFAVLVTGGFHSKPMREHFEKAGYAYGVVTPAITGLDEAGYQAYLNAMLSTSSAQAAAPNQMIELALGSGARLGGATQLKRTALTVRRVRANKALEGWRAARSSTLPAKARAAIARSEARESVLKRDGVFEIIESPDLRLRLRVSEFLFGSTRWGQVTTGTIRFQMEQFQDERWVALSPTDENKQEIVVPAVDGSKLAVASLFSPIAWSGEHRSFSALIEKDQRISLRIFENQNNAIRQHVVSLSSIQENAANSSVVVSGDKFEVSVILDDAIEVVNGQANRSDADPDAKPNDYDFAFRQLSDYRNQFSAANDLISDVRRWEQSEDDVQKLMSRVVSQALGRSQRSEARGAGVFPWKAVLATASATLSASAFMANALSEVYYQTVIQPAQKMLEGEIERPEILEMLMPISGQFLALTVFVLLPRMLQKTIIYYSAWFAAGWFVYGKSDWGAPAFGLVGIGVGVAFHAAYVASQSNRSEAREWKNPNSQKIVVIGTGFVGATKAVLAATDYGHDVVGVEASPEKREKLARAEPTFTAKYFPELLKEAVDSGKLNFTSNSPEDLAAALLGREIVYLALPTPQSESGEADIRFLKDAVRQIANAVKPGERKILIGKSTAPPKMTVDALRAVLNEVLAERRARDEVILNSDIQFAWEPEFLREGAEVEDDRELSARIVIGAETPEVAARVKAVYENFNPNLNPPRKQLKIITTDLVSAPLVKYAANGWRGTKISFINYISWLTEELGFDIDEVANAIGEDSRVVRSFLNCGLGFGGSCFPKDLAAFVKMAKDLDISPGIVLDALAVNQVQVDRFVSQMINELDGVSGKKIVILGGAFKPETSDTREARSIIVARELLAKGANIIVVDPDQGAIRELERELQGYGARLKFYTSLEKQAEIFSDASAIALVTEWKEFKSISFDQVRRLFERGVELPKIFDGRNALNGSQLRDLGFKYFDLGRGEEAAGLVDERKFINAVTLLFLALRISYMNTLAEMAEKLGANIHDVKLGFGYDPVVSNAAKGGEIEYLNPGLGWGGYHLPQAVDFMSKISGQAELFATLNQFDAARNAILEKFGISKDALENTRVPFVDTAKAINQRQIQVAVEKMKRELGATSLVGVKIAVAGLAHKQGENIDSSPSIALIQALAAEGAEIHAWDPDEGVRTSVNHLLKKTSTAQQVHYFDDLHEAMRTTEMQVIAYVSPEFLNKPEKLVRDAAGQVTASFIFDARHIFVNPAVFSQFGVSYAAVGMPTLRSESRGNTPFSENLTPFALLQSMADRALVAAQKAKKSSKITAIMTASEKVLAAMKKEFDSFGPEDRQAWDQYFESYGYEAVFYNLVESIYTYAVVFHSQAGEDESAPLPDDTVLAVRKLLRRELEAFWKNPGQTNLNLLRRLQASMTRSVSMEQLIVRELFQSGLLGAMAEMGFAGLGGDIPISIEVLPLDGDDDGLLWGGDRRSEARLLSAEDVAAVQAALREEIQIGEVVLNNGLAGLLEDGEKSLQIHDGEALHPEATNVHPTNAYILMNFDWAKVWPVVEKLTAEQPSWKAVETVLTPHLQAALPKFGIGDAHWLLEHRQDDRYTKSVVILFKARSEARLYDVASAREALTKIKDHNDVPSAIRGQAGRYLGGLGVSGGRRGSFIPRYVGDFLRQTQSAYPQVFRSESRSKANQQSAAVSNSGGRRGQAVKKVESGVVARAGYQTRRDLSARRSELRVDSEILVNDVMWRHNNGSKLIALPLEERIQALPEIIRNLKNPGWRFLNQTKDHHQAEVLVALAKILTSMGSAAKSAVPHLLAFYAWDFYHAENTALVNNAIDETLKAVGPLSGDEADEMMKQLQRMDVSQESDLAVKLAGLLVNASSPQKVKKLLARAAEDIDDFLLPEFLEHLVKVDPDAAKRFIPRLVGVVSSEVVSLEKKLQLLEKIGAPHDDALDELMELAVYIDMVYLKTSRRYHDLDWIEVRIAAITALGMMGKRAAKAKPLLRELTNKNESSGWNAKWWWNLAGERRRYYQAAAAALKAIEGRSEARMNKAQLFDEIAKMMNLTFITQGNVPRTFNLFVDEVRVGEVEGVQLSDLLDDGWADFESKLDRQLGYLFEGADEIHISVGDSVGANAIYLTTRSEARENPIEAFKEQLVHEREKNTGIWLSKSFAGLVGIVVGGILFAALGLGSMAIVGVGLGGIAGFFGIALVYGDVLDTKYFDNLEKILDDSANPDRINLLRAKQIEIESGAYQSLIPSPLNEAALKAIEYVLSRSEVRNFKAETWSYEKGNVLVVVSPADFEALNELFMARIPADYVVDGKLTFNFDLYQPYQIRSVQAPAGSNQQDIDVGDLNLSFKPIVPTEGVFKFEPLVYSAPWSVGGDSIAPQSLQALYEARDTSNFKLDQITIVRQSPTIPEQTIEIVVQVPSAMSLSPAAFLDTWFEQKNAGLSFERSVERKLIKKITFVGSGVAVSPAARGVNQPSPDYLNLFSQSYVEQVAKGVAGEEGGLAAVVSYVPEPTGKEKGLFYAVDFGGTNFRVMAVRLKGDGRYEIVGTPLKVKLPSDLMKGPSQNLFAFFAEKFKAYVSDIQQQGLIRAGEEAVRIGFTYSYPAKLNGRVDSVTAIALSKNLQSPDLVGQDVALLFQDALDLQFEEQSAKPQVVAVANDTVGTAVVGKLQNPRSIAGLILGTGRNLARKIKSSLVRNLEGFSGEWIYLNDESGLNTKVPESEAVISKTDKKLFELYKHLGPDIYQKMTSGMYVPELIRLRLLEAAEQGLIFQSGIPYYLSSAWNEEDLVPEGLLKLFSDMTLASELQDYPSTAKALAKLGVNLPAQREVELFYSTVVGFYRRSAYLSAPEIMGTALSYSPELNEEVVISIDGSLFEKVPAYKGWIETALADIAELHFGDREKAKNIKLELVKDGSGIGAAMIAAIVTARSEQRLIPSRSEVYTATQTDYRQTLEIARLKLLSWLGGIVPQSWLSAIGFTDAARQVRAITGADAFAEEVPVERRGVLASDYAEKNYVAKPETAEFSSKIILDISFVEEFLEAKDALGLFALLQNSAGLIVFDTTGNLSQRLQDKINNRQSRLSAQQKQVALESVKGLKVMSVNSQTLYGEISALAKNPDTAVLLASADGLEKISGKLVMALRETLHAGDAQALVALIRILKQAAMLDAEAASDYLQRQIDGLRRQGRGWLADSIQSLISSLIKNHELVAVSA